MMSNKRVGHWSWALSAEEGMTVLAFSTAAQEGRRLAPRLAQRYAAMLAKQAKLEARLPRRVPRASVNWH